jgi:hypothetical protein
LHINDTGIKFATNTASVIDTGGKFAIGVIDTVGNLPMVSTTLVANLLQIMGTLSDCWRLKVNLKKKFMLTLRPKDVLKKLQFSDWRFFYLPPVTTTPASATPVVHLKLWILKFTKKNWNGPNGILWDWGEIDSWKKPEVENLVTLSL